MMVFLISERRTIMKSTHEEADTRMQKLVSAALENQKRISATLDVKDAFYCYIFTTWLTG